jgi:hypothetical protein
VTKKDVGIHPIEIVVADASGAKTAQRFDLHIFDFSEKPVSSPP